MPALIPGFRLTLGITLAWLGVLVVLPLAALAAKASGLTWDQFAAVVFSHRTLAAFQLSFGAAFIAALVNLAAGTLVAWVLVRYRFPGRAVVDALIDLPFALPTAVAGIALTALYAPNGWLGGLLAPLGIKVAYANAGVAVALVFVGLPFVVRTVQPVLADLPAEVEEASACLGASRWQTVRRVLLPELWPAALTGFALAFARGVGEFGSVIFIASNKPNDGEIAPLLIIIRLESYQIAEATAVAVAMLAVSFALLLGINLLQRWMAKRSGR